MPAHAVVYDKSTGTITGVYTAPHESYVLTQPYDKETEDILLISADAVHNAQELYRVNVATKELIQKD